MTHINHQHESDEYTMSKYDEDDDVKTRRRYEDEDEDDRPARRSRSRYEDEDDSEDDRPRRSASARDDEDEDRPKAARRVIKGGWGAAERIKDVDSPFAQRLKLSEDPIIIKFLEDEPYASYRQHWIERQGQKSFTCISDIDDAGCPLCDIGNRPATRFSFNVALLARGEDPVVKSYDVGPRVIDQLKNFHSDPIQGPLTKNYWAVSRTGKGTTSATNHQMIKPRDLPEDWRVEPLSERDIEALLRGCYTADIISIPKRKELLAVADEES